MLVSMRLRDRQLELPAARGARAVALGLVADAAVAAGRLEAGTDPEALHDFRVALRRLRSALRAFRPWLAGRVPRRLEKRLRRLAGSTGAARDAEVQLAWIGAQRAGLGPRASAGVAWVVARIEARGRRGPGRERLAARWRRLGRRLSRRLGAGGPRGESGATFAEALASLLADRLAALRAAMDAIQGPADEEAVHRARIEGKRLRYLLEPLRGLSRADASAAVDGLKRLQDLLGDLHDAHLLAAALRSALVDAAAERAVLLHAAVYAPGAGARAAREALRRPSPRPGVVALLRRVGQRRDALHAELDGEWAGAGAAALAAGVEAVAAGLLPPATGAPRAARARRPARERSRGRAAHAARRG